MRRTARRDAAGRDTKAEIHRVAVELFSSRGYEKTSLREIAEHVGITKASLYYHYSSKQDLLRAIVGTFFDEIRRVLSAAQDTPWSPEAERELFLAYLDVVIRHRHTGPALLRDLSAVLAAYEDSVDELMKSMHQFHAWLAGPDASVADRLRATAATETVGAVLSSGLTPDQASDAEMREALLDAALAVLARRDARPGERVPVES
jgi:AcrR family transcriptional regulator